MHRTYKVPVVSQNLRQEETIVQIGDTLRHLSNVSKDIFARINKRIDQNRQKLGRLENRIKVANDEVVRLSGAKKATRIISSCKYPASDVQQRFDTLFDAPEDDITLQRSQVAFDNVRTVDDALETLQFYHVKNGELPQENPVGLGHIPGDLTSVNDLFLFNTTTNPYRKYVLSDPLQATSSNVRKDRPSEDASRIGDAPHSIADRTSLTTSAAETYFYSPDLGQVPSIDVPLDLPDLPGVADDLRYIDIQEPGIAPSVVATLSHNIPSRVSSNPELSVDTLASQLDDSLLILPEPPVEQSLSHTQDSPIIVAAATQKIPVVTPEPEVLPILPSVEPTVILTTPQSSINKPQSTPTPVLLPQLDDSRSSLMEAIRQAGKNKVLKSVANREENTAHTPSSSGSGNLMADLHAKLSLRRKGISGTKKDGETIDPQSTLSKISAMIPPPSPKFKSESSNSDDQEDWEP